MQLSLHLLVKLSMYLPAYITLFNISFTTEISKNGIKYFVEIDQWPFVSYKNKVRLEIKIIPTPYFHSIFYKLSVGMPSAYVGSSTMCQQVQVGVDGSNNVNWYKLQVGDQSLYLKIFLMGIWNTINSMYFFIWIDTANFLMLQKLMVALEKCNSRVCFVIFVILI